MEVSSSPTKHQRTDLDCESDEDSIDRLPDDILCHILSFLPIKYVVKTSVLARRWRYLWTSTPNLCFNMDWLFYDGDPCGKGFRNFVDKALSLGTSSIKKFCLKCANNHSYDASQLNKWIRAVLSRNVEEFHLRLQGFWDGDVVCLPTNPFIHKKLSVLKLHGELRLPSSQNVYLPSLKACHFRLVRSSITDFLGVLLSGCPILEELEIKTTPTKENLPVLRICSSSLKSLSIFRSPIQYLGNGCPKLVIDTPQLQLLDLMDFTSEEFEVSMCPFLAKADIYVKKPLGSTKTSYEYGLEVIKLLRQIAPQVRELRLTSDTYQTLAGFDVSAVAFRKLNRLEIFADKNHKVRLPIPLFRTPILGMVIFNTTYCEIEWDFEELVLKNWLSSVRTIEVLNFKARPAEMEMIKCCLRNALLLKELIISVNDLSSDGMQRIMSKDILTFTRASTECEVIFRAMEHRYKKAILWCAS